MIENNTSSGKEEIAAAPPSLWCNAMLMARARLM
jgi:hypothetical protein